jgi:hypothetical protein
MARRIAFVVPALMIAALWTGVPQAGAQSGGGCQLSGNANFNTPLTNNNADFTYSFTGTLSNCMSNVQGAPSDGVVSAGTTISIPGVKGKYQEPVPQGNGTCGNGTTAGISVVQWSNKQVTLINYSTNSAGPAVVLQGSVIGSVKLKNVAWKRGQPKSYTLKSSAYAGAGAIGLLTFTPPDPQDCGGSGVKSAPINGFTGIGNQ